ncbi:hypothetical protein ACKKBF_B15720 [Auxenochlorella protothecoides x Auxenochlorella symbiontica]
MSSFWEAWQPRPADLKALRTPNPHLPFPATSPLLILPGSPVTPLHLPLFGATCTSTAGVLAPDQPLPDAAAAEDVCLFVGGPVWALAWCPHSLPHGKHAPGAAHEAAVDFLALACHPPGQPRHTIGAPASGPAAVQVWALPRPGARGGKDTPLPPSLHCVLPHDGGVTWGLAWCPDPGACLLDADPGSEPGAPGRLGLLAACQGDGLVAVHAVPARPGPGPGPVAARARVACLNVAALGTLPSCLDWAPAAPHDTLLIGCWDGSALLLKLAPSALGADGRSGPSAGAGGLRPLARYAADTLPLRGVSFFPPGENDDAGAPDPAARHTFAAAGQGGALTVWDARDPLGPAYAQLLTSGCLLGLAWTADPRGLLVACDDGAVRGVLVDARALAQNAACNGGKVNNSFSWRGAGQGALWTLCVEPRLQLVAYGGEDGVVGVFVAGFQQDNRKRPAHHPVAGFQFREGALHVLDPGQLAASHGLYAGKSVERLPALKGRPFPPEAQAVTRMAWHPNAGEKWGRLATGCWAGLVRVQTIYRR